jgi:predicted dehydrogenase/threonine dehydrogenase-like Zn-dependent dehydrogenase
MPLFSGRRDESRRSTLKRAPQSVRHDAGERTIRLSFPFRTFSQQPAGIDQSIDPLMIQLLQSLRDGTTTVPEIPCPAAGRNGLLLRTRATLISAGTERMLLDFGKAGWIDKARQQPDQVRKVLEKVSTDGLAATLESVQAKLDQPIPLGYSNAGVVLEAGAGVSGFQLGDRVASNGAHAEVVRVPANLCARIPDSVPDEHAAFTVVSAIALEGIRLAQPTLGETFVVTGLGLIGLIAVQLLRAHGCRVLGIDLDPRKAEIARRFGVAAADRFTGGRGVDGVLITASTKSNEPVHQAAQMCRKRGRIVLVGVTGLQLSRDDFYKKELSFQVSCSYGPGRYDAAYEEGGQDYPYGFVRWTEQRNFEAVLEMMASGRLDVGPLITHRFPFERAREAYDLMQTDAFYLGILLEYPGEAVLDRTVALNPAACLQDASLAAGKGNLGFIGAGGYASKILIPAFKSAGAGLVAIASSGGVSAAHAGRKFGFAEATTDVDALLGDTRTDTIVIATRHNSHADLVRRALQAGKNVFVEKPLAITVAEVEEIEAVYAGLERRPLLMVGFNRRFAPHVVKMRELLRAVPGAKAFVYTVNAGAIPAEHWTVNAEIGGGRIVGEACHFIDLLRFLAGVSATAIHSTALSAQTATITLAFEDGSIGTIHYLANGHKSFPKERLEVFAGNRILQLDNFRKLTGFGWPGFHKMNLWRQDKGANACAAAFLKAVREGTSSPIPFSELIEVSRLTLSAAALS